MASGTFTAVGQVSDAVLLPSGNAVTVTLGSGAWVAVERLMGTSAWEQVAAYPVAVTARIANTSREAWTLRLRVLSYDGSPVAWGVTPDTGDEVLAEWRTSEGRLIATVTDEGMVRGDGVAGLSPSTLVWVNAAGDFPAAVNGVRTLADNATYFVTGEVDLLGDRLVGGQNTTILGGSSENCRLKSTGLSGTAIITSEWSLPMRGLTIEADVALALDADGNANQALDWFGVNFTGCATVGTVANYSNFIATDCAWLNSQGMTFDGSIGTVGFNQCLFDNRASGTSLILPATLTITRRFRATYSAFVSLSGETGINVNSSATIPVEGYILDTCNFSGGGTYTAGVGNTDNKALWVNNRGVKNSAEVGFMTMVANATATTIGDIGVAVKAAGTTTFEAVSQKFSHTDNRLTYTGAITRDFRVIATATCSSGNGHQIGLYIAKNGTVLGNSEQYITANASGRAEGGSVQCIVELATTDYLEFWVENATAATNITVSELSVIAEAIN